MHGARKSQRELFATRFEPEGDGYVFRPNLAAEGIRVSAAERDRFVDDYARGMTLTMWLSAPIIVAFIMGSLLLSERFYPEGDAPPWLSALLLLMIFPIFWARISWLNKAPLRELGTSRAMVAGRTKAEARRIGLSRLTWAQLAVSLPLMAYVFWRLSGGEVLEGWHRLWLAAFGAFVVLVGLQAYRKWRAGQAPKPPGTVSDGRE